MKIPTKKAVICAYCTGDGVHIIDPEVYPNDVYAERREKGIMCGDCIDQLWNDRMVKISPTSSRAKEIMAEDKRNVDKHNTAALRLNNSARRLLMPYKSYRYRRKR